MYMNLLAVVLCVVGCRYCYGRGGGGRAYFSSPSTVGMQGWMVGRRAHSYITFDPLPDGQLTQITLVLTVEFTALQLAICILYSVLCILYSFSAFFILYSILSVVEFCASCTV